MAIQGIEGVLSQLQATAMTARNQSVADQPPGVSFAHKPKSSPIRKKDLKL